MTQTLVRMRAEAMMLHKGKNLLRGALFSVPANEAEDLVALHFASVAEEELPQTAVLETKQELAADDSPRKAKPTLRRRTAVQTEEPDPPSGRYSRRDLRAEN